MPTQPNDLQILDIEIKHLQRKARNLEQELDGRLDYFYDNHRSLVVKSFLPAFLAKAGLTGTVIEMFMENTKIRNAVNQMSSSLVDKLSHGLALLVSKFGKKESPEA